MFDDVQWNGFTPLGQGQDVHVDGDYNGTQTELERGRDALPC